MPSSVAALAVETYIGAFAAIESRSLIILLCERQRPSVSGRISCGFNIDFCVRLLAGDSGVSQEYITSWEDNCLMCEWSLNKEYLVGRPNSWSGFWGVFSIVISTSRPNPLGTAPPTPLNIHQGMPDSAHPSQRCTTVRIHNHGGRLRACSHILRAGI